MERAQNRPDTVTVGALDDILGARARVVVLRHLSGVKQQAWPSEIVRATGLPRSTVWYALKKLEAQGVITPWPIEVRRQVPWRMAPGHPLREPLIALFRAEWEGGLITDPEAEREREFREEMKKAREKLRAQGIPIPDHDWW